MARKNAIIDAALVVVGEVGIAGLSMRVVAAQAGIPLAAVGYYFTGKDDLINAAFERHVQRETARVTRAITRMGDSPGPADLADRLTDFVVTGLTAARHQLLAEYEFTIEAVRRPVLAEASAAWQAILGAQLQAVVESLGSPRPKADARLILSVLAGLEIDHLSTPVEVAQAQMISDVLHRLLSVLALTWTPGQQDGRNGS
ncbi:hypothetical protein MANY_40080 [Mycolicibacterium anyangense]|uniref:HTH tetR-type domain-containing protein n=1 Tax=Mycolicibacterium anyangense TaxID=1431246 RepID=A0A6N4WHI3_9MYCO|nr:hypothetical protein MANY_40080 [Mycolicibacterium anyangense]